jgi:hypothetical protein
MDTPNIEPNKRRIYWGERRASEEISSAAYLRVCDFHLGITFTCNCVYAFKTKDANHLHQLENWISAGIQNRKMRYANL